MDLTPGCLICISPSSLNNNNCATENVETAGGDPFIVGDVGSLQSILEDYLEVDRYQVRWGAEAYRIEK